MAAMLPFMHFGDCKSWANACLCLQVHPNAPTWLIRARLRSNGVQKQSSDWNTTLANVAGTLDAPSPVRLWCGSASFTAGEYGVTSQCYVSIRCYCATCRHMYAPNLPELLHKLQCCNLRMAKAACISRLHGFACNSNWVATELRRLDLVVDCPVDGRSCYRPAPVPSPSGPMAMLYPQHRSVHTARLTTRNSRAQPLSGHLTANRPTSWILLQRTCCVAVEAPLGPRHGSATRAGQLPCWTALPPLCAQARACWRAGDPPASS